MTCWDLLCAVLTRQTLPPVFSGLQLQRWPLFRVWCQGLTGWSCIELFAQDFVRECSMMGNILDNIRLLVRVCVFFFSPTTWSGWLQQLHNRFEPTKTRTGCVHKLFQYFAQINAHSHALMQDIPTKCFRNFRYWHPERLEVISDSPSKGWQSQDILYSQAVNAVIESKREKKKEKTQGHNGLWENSICMVSKRQQIEFCQACSAMINNFSNFHAILHRADQETENDTRKDYIHSNGCKFKIRNMWEWNR